MLMPFLRRLLGGDSGTVYEGPIAEFSSVVDVLDVEFTDESTAGDTAIVAWLWDFGDGNASTEEDPEHTYDETGEYTVRLTVTDANGASNYTEQTVEISLIYPADGTELATFMAHGTAPTSMWLFTGATGTVQDLQAANNDLTPSGGVTQEIDSTVLSSISARIPDNDADARLTGPDALDVTDTDSLAVLLVVDITGTHASNRQLCAKGTSTRWETRINASGHPAINCHDGTNEDVETLAADHRNLGSPSTILFVFDRDADSVQVHSQLGSSAGQTVAATLTLENAVTFIIGAVGYNSAGLDISMAAVWVGAGAEGLGAANITALRAAMGL